MEKHLIEIVKSKSYLELSVNEQNALKDWIHNEEDFEALKFLYVGLEDLTEVHEPEGHVKKRLDELFYEIHPQPNYFTGLILFLFPPQKTIFFKPGFQFGISLVLAVILFLTVKPSEELAIQKQKPLSAEIKKEVTTGQNKKEIKNENSSIKVAKKNTQEFQVEPMNLTTLDHNPSGAMQMNDNYASTEFKEEIEDIELTLDKEFQIIPTMIGNESLLEYLNPTY